MPIMNLEGQRYGRLLVISVVDLAERSGPRWLCRCDCGKEKAVLAACLRKGATKSCGCLNAELSSARCDNHQKPMVSTLNLLLRERDGLREALTRLHAWALAQEGDCLYSGDHPIAQAAAALTSLPPKG